MRLTYRLSTYVFFLSLSLLPTVSLANQDLQSTQSIQTNADPGTSQSNPQNGASQLLQPAGTNTLQVSTDQLTVLEGEIGGTSTAPTIGWRRYWPQIASGLVILIASCFGLLVIRLRRNQRSD